MIRVTAIETGKARMKTAQRTGRDGRGPVGRKIDIFRDRDWVAPLPILCFLIEHPEGRFLVDTGDTWRNSVPGYLPGWTRSTSRSRSASRRGRRWAAARRHGPRPGPRPVGGGADPLPPRPYRRARPLPAHPHHRPARELCRLDRAQGDDDGVPAAALAGLAAAGARGDGRAGGRSVPGVARADHGRPDPYGANARARRRALRRGRDRRGRHLLPGRGRHPTTRRTCGPG